MEQIVKTSIAPKQRSSIRSKKEVLLEAIDKMCVLSLTPSSKLCLLHRPTKLHLQLLKQRKQLDVVVTCQSAKEDAKEVGRWCREVGLQWWWVDLNGAGKSVFMDQKVQAYLINQLKDINAKLNTNQHNILIHCAAGIHRTGVMSYCLLRMNGETKQGAVEKLKQLRDATHKGVGEWRLEMAEEKLLPHLLQQNQNNNYNKEEMHNHQKEQINDNKEKINIVNKEEINLDNKLVLEKKE